MKTQVLFLLSVSLVLTGLSDWLVNSAHANAAEILKSANIVQAVAANKHQIDRGARRLTAEIVQLIRK